MKKIVISIIILAVAIGGAFIFLGRKTSAPSTTNTATNTESSANTEKTSDVESTMAADNTAAATVIRYTNDGFDATPLTVKSGDTVEIKNTSSHAVQLDSDPHPVHTNDADLNVGLIPAGQSKKFTLTKKGTWGYHNHLNSSETGSVTVQ